MSRVWGTWLFRIHKMKIIKVIVDEMPKTCLDCDFLRTYTPHKGTDWEGCDEHYCDFIGEEVVGDGRSDWCPLMELKDNEKIGKFIFKGKGNSTINNEMRVDESER